MVLRDRLTEVDVWFGFQVDGKFSLQMPNWPQSGTVKREFRGSKNLWVIGLACLPQFLRGKNSSPGDRHLQFPLVHNQHNLCCMTRVKIVLLPRTEAISALWGWIFHEISLENRTRHQLPWASVTQHHRNDTKTAYKIRSIVKISPFPPPCVFTVWFQKLKRRNEFCLPFDRKLFSDSWPWWGVRKWWSGEVVKWWSGEVVRTLKIFSVGSFPS